jgi:hypothetical protein
MILFLCNWGGRIRTYEWRSQSPQPYHLATPQRSEQTNRKIPKLHHLKCNIGQEGIRTPDTVVRSHVL